MCETEDEWGKEGWEFFLFVSGRLREAVQAYGEKNIMSFLKTLFNASPNLFLLPSVLPSFYLSFLFFPSFSSNDQSFWTKELGLVGIDEKGA